MAAKTQLKLSIEPQIINWDGSKNLDINYNQNQTNLNFGRVGGHFDNSGRDGRDFFRDFAWDIELNTYTKFGQILISSF